jgi:hypothetical protein
MTVDTHTDAARVREVRAPPPEHSDAIETVEELAAYPLRPGDPAVHLTADKLYFVVRHREQPAGAVGLSCGVTVAEWAECDPDADVVEVVSADRLERSLGTYAGFGDILAAVRDGRVQPVAIPEARLFRCLDEFAEAYQRGEWPGFADYVREAATND